MEGFVFYCRLPSQIDKELWVNKDTQKFLIAKRVIIGNDQENNNLLTNELKILQSLDEQFVVATLGCDFTYSRNITKKDILDRQLRNIQTTLQMLHHKHHIVFRHLSPDSILMDEWDNPVLDDFGLSKQLSYTYERMGTQLNIGQYQAPEMFYGDYQIFVDVWSLGVLLIWMFTEKEFPIEFYINQQYKTLILPSQIIEKHKVFQLSLLDMLLMEDNQRRPDINIIVNYIQNICLDKQDPDL